MADTYPIADEPKGKLTHIAVPPLLLLFASIFIPRPFQFLMPFAFLVNGWLMGCHNLGKQVVTVVIGGILIFVLLLGMGFIASSGILPIDAGTLNPYLRILFNAAFFILLYRLLLLQNPVYELLSYIKEQGGS